MGFEFIAEGTSQAIQVWEERGMGNVHAIQLVERLLAQFRAFEHKFDDAVFSLPQNFVNGPFEVKGAGKGARLSNHALVFEKGFTDGEIMPVASENSENHFFDRELVSKIAAQGFQFVDSFLFA